MKCSLEQQFYRLVPCITQLATCAAQPRQQPELALIYLMAPPRKVWTAAEEANRRATRVAVAWQHRAQQTAVQREAQTVACCRRRADSSVHS